MEQFELRGHDLVLAVPTVNDIDRITECCQDPEIQRWSKSLPVPYRRSDAETFVTKVVPAGWRDESDLSWAIRDPEDRRLLGVVGLRPKPRGLGNIGFWVAPDSRGEHVASRAVRLVAEYAFDPGGLDLTYLHWNAFAGNWASRKVAWRCGFSFGGTVRGGINGRDARKDMWFATLKAGEPMEQKSLWLQIPEVRGETVMLRPFTKSDAEALVEMCSDPMSQHWLSSLPSPYTRDDALMFIELSREQAATGGGVYWAAARPEGGPAVGSFSLMGLDRRSGGGEIGYAVHPAVRGTGVATEAVHLMLRHAFGSKAGGGLELRRIIVAHVAGNAASRKPIERNGFQPIGIERAVHQFRDGTIADLHWYDLLSDDFSNAMVIRAR